MPAIAAMPAKAWPPAAHARGHAMGGGMSCLKCSLALTITALCAGGMLLLQAMVTLSPAVGLSLEPSGRPSQPAGTIAKAVVVAVQPTGGLESCREVRTSPDLNGTCCTCLATLLHDV